MIRPRRTRRDGAGRHLARAAALELREVSTDLGHRDIDLTVYDGEVLGLYGLVGSGAPNWPVPSSGSARSPRARSVCAAGRRPSVGERGAPSFRDWLRQRDRKQEDVILLHGVLANAGITLWRRLRRWTWLRDQPIVAAVTPVLHHLNVRMVSLQSPVVFLSGGNQQKVKFCQMAGRPHRIANHSEPTTGVDIGTKADLYVLIRTPGAGPATGHHLRHGGADWARDRIVVMLDYRIVGELANTRDYPTMSSAIMGLISRTRRPRDRGRGAWGRLGGPRRDFPVKPRCVTRSPSPSSAAPSHRRR